MASFTDKVPQFNPYIEQLPVEAMVKVGMEKQRRYDEGVQKIQSQIDNIAGLDIAKDAHKTYLQSKLNELGSRLKTVAAGDFSNYQLTNSVGGMTNQIVKDPIIQNAVYSTQVIRKGQAELDNAKKEGKSSVQNEEWWNKQINDWEQNPDLATKFTGSYVQYTDVDKKLREIAEKVHEIDTSIDIPYKRDAQGNTLYYVTDPKTGQSTVSTDPNSGGTPKVDDAMLRIKTKGKPAEKILGNFMSSLNENDQRQMRIDSWYHYRGVTKDSMIADVTSNYNNAKHLQFSQIVNLSTELQTNTKLSESDKSAIQAKINDLNEQSKKGTLDAEYQRQVSEIANASDIESYKYKIYADKYLTKLAKDMSYESYQKEYMNNPYFQADMQKKNLQFKYENMARMQNNWKMDYAFKQYALERRLEAAAKKGQVKEEDLAQFTSDPIPTGEHAPTMELIAQQIDAIKNPSTGAIAQLDAKFAPLVSATKDMADNTQKKAYLDNLMDSYTRDSSFITKQTDPEVIKYLRTRKQYEDEAALKHSLLLEAEEKAGMYNEAMDAVVGAEPGMAISSGINYTAKDMLDFSTKLRNFYTKEGVAAGLYSASATKELDKEGLLKSYRGTKFEPLVVAHLKHLNGDPMTQEEKAMSSRAQGLYEKYMGTAAMIAKDKNTFQSKYLAERLPEFQTMSSGLLETNKPDMKAVERLVDMKYKHSMETKGKIDSDLDKDYNAATVDAIMKDKDRRIILTKRQDGTAELILRSEKAGEQKISMTSKQFRDSFPMYAIENPMTDYGRMIVANPNRTTNINGTDRPEAAVSARINGSSMPGLARTDYADQVRADIRGGSDPNEYQVILYVNKGNGTWIREAMNPEYVNSAGVTAILNSIGTVTIEQILKNHK